MSASIILALLGGLMLVQGLLTALSVIARLLWSILGAALIYAVILRYWVR